MAKTGPTENRYALCIGINQAGTLSPLKFAENDAEALHALLLQKGFAAENCKLLLGADATTQNINIALKEFIGGKPKRNDLVLFYFAGHGEPLEGEDEETDIYLATADYHPQLIESDDAFRSYDALGLARLRRDFFERSKSNKILFIFDSCYSGDFPGKNFRGPNPAQGYVQQLMGEMSAGKVALSSCLPHQTSSEPTKLGHGLFTYHLLQALRGEAEKEIYPYGELTIGSLFKHLSRNLPKEQIPVLTGTQHGDFVLLDFPEKIEAANQSGSSARETASIDKSTRLRAMFSDHSGFMRDRLESFVGRATELAEIQQQIAEKLTTGGYITITGQAGQGKSSVIAKLVQQLMQQATDDDTGLSHLNQLNLTNLNAILTSNV
ncbi:MAG: caspase family protein [Chloroflexi bacterium]|nr:caspase family protein [Chloroflexota bacterium]